MKKTWLSRWSAAFLWCAALLGGVLLGYAAPQAGQVAGGAVDPLILLLVAILFFTVRFEGLGVLLAAPKVVILVLGINFALIPLLAFALTSVLIPDEVLKIGVLIYCLFPCTDWFLGFVRAAGGNTAIGAALIPIQMALQLLLYPVWLSLFTGTQVTAVVGELGPVMFTWFVLPAVAAIALRVLMKLVTSENWQKAVIAAADRTVPYVIAALICAIFATNTGTILENPGAFLWILPVVFLFFAITFGIAEIAAKWGKLSYPDQALLSITTAARNPPLMLAVTSLTVFDQPVILAAIVVGMLVEFPHLIAITQLLKKVHRRAIQKSDPATTDHAEASEMTGSYI